MVNFNSFTNNNIMKRLQNGWNVDSVGAKCREGFTCLSRCILVYINSLVLLCAFILIGLGVYQQLYWSMFPWRTTIDATLIGLGLMIATIAFFGFFGAMQENVRMLMMYAVILLTMLIVQAFYYTFHVAVVNHVIQSKVVVENVLWFLYENRLYFVFGFVINNINQALHCCGMYGPQRLALRLQYFQNETVMGSCCSDGNYPCLVEDAFQQSCVSEVDDYFPLILDVTSTIVLLLGASQLIYAALAFFISYAVKRRTAKYERIPEIFTISDK